MNKKIIFPAVVTAFVAALAISLIYKPQKIDPPPKENHISSGINEVQKSPSYQTVGVVTIPEKKFITAERGLSVAGRTKVPEDSPSIPVKYRKANSGFQAEEVEND